MQALWLEDRRLTVRDDLPAPEPPVGESLIKVIATGICNTDLELLKNRRVQVGQLIDERYPLRDALLAFERASAGTPKVLIDIHER